MALKYRVPIKIYQGAWLQNVQNIQWPKCKWPLTFFCSSPPSRFGRNGGERGNVFRPRCAINSPIMDAIPAAARSLSEVQGRSFAYTYRIQQANRGHERRRKLRKIKTPANESAETRAGIDHRLHSLQQPASRTRGSRTRNQTQGKTEEENGGRQKKKRRRELEKNHKKTRDRTQGGEREKQGEKERNRGAKTE